MSKLELYAIAGVLAIVLVAAAYLKGHHSGYVEGKQEIQVEFDKFKNDTAAAGLKAEKDKIQKEKDDKESCKQHQSTTTHSAYPTLSISRRSLPLPWSGRPSSLQPSCTLTFLTDMKEGKSNC